MAVMLIIIDKDVGNFQNAQKENYLTFVKSKIIMIVFGIKIMVYVLIEPVKQLLQKLLILFKI